MGRQKKNEKNQKKAFMGRQKKNEKNQKKAFMGRQNMNEHFKLHFWKKKDFN